MPRRKKDFYYNKAKQEGYRSRAAYKLKRINEKFNIIRKGDVVVDLGAAPGGWLQVARELSGSRVLGVDLQAIEPIEGVETIRGDIRATETVDRITWMIEKADAVICDAAPDLSGNWSYDHARSIDLASAAFGAAKQILRTGGNFVVKVFQGDMYEEFLNKIKKEFSQVKAYKSEASRKESAEIYIVARGLLSAPVRAGDVHEILVEGTGKSGDGIASIQGFIIFVKGAKQGDKLKVRIREVKEKFAVATPLESESLISL